MPTVYLGSMDDRRSRFVEATDRPGGWPRVPAQALAAALHVVLLAVMVLTWRTVPEHPAERAVTVALVTAPPPKPVAAPPKPRPAPRPPLPAPREQRAASSAPPAVATPAKAQSPPPARAAKTAAVSSSQVLPQPPRPKPLVAERPPPQEKPSRPAVTAHVEAGVAIYSVTVEKAGGIGAITLLQSSGTPQFDAAGEQMIRRSMMFQPPSGPGDATRYFSVTIRFTPKTQ